MRNPFRKSTVSSVMSGFVAQIAALEAIEEAQMEQAEAMYEKSFDIRDAAFETCEQELEAAEAKLIAAQEKVERLRLKAVQRRSDSYVKSDTYVGKAMAATMEAEDADRMASKLREFLS